MKIYCKVVNGQYKDREGYLLKGPNELGLVMFYSKEGSFPYRTCLRYEDVEVNNG